MFYVLAVLQDLHLLQRHKPARHDGVESGQKRFDLVLGVDDLDDERQVLAHIEDFGRVKPSRMAEAHRAAQHSRPREMCLARLEDDRLVKRPMMKFRVFAYEDAQEHGVAWESHRSKSLPPTPPRAASVP